MVKRFLIGSYTLRSGWCLILSAKKDLSRVGDGGSMIQDLRTLGDGMQFSADVCLVGAAGIALASNSLEIVLSIILLESGGLEPKESDQNLNDGDIAGLLYKGLKYGRALAPLVASTKLWFGQCIRFDPIDFEKRPWVPQVVVGPLAPKISNHGTSARSACSKNSRRALRRGNLQEDAHTCASGIRNRMTHFTIYSPNVDLGSLYGDRFVVSTRLQVLPARQCHRDSKPTKTVAKKLSTFAP